MTSQLVLHPLPPLIDSESRILILGTMPSPRSRQEAFFYAHPQNRFWPTLAAVYGEQLPLTREERTDFVRRHHLALWDTLAACRIEGASDSTIRDAVPNDIAALLRQYPSIHTICCTGTTSHRFYTKLIQPTTGIPAKLLPSPSGANARMNLAALTEAYRAALL